MTFQKCRADESHLLSPVTPPRRTAERARSVFEDFSPPLEPTSQPSRLFWSQNALAGAELSKKRPQSQSEPLMPNFFGMNTPDGQSPVQRPRSAENYRTKRHRPSRIIRERAIPFPPAYSYQSATLFGLHTATGEPPSVTRVANHQDLLRTPKDTLITFDVGTKDFLSAYVVQFDLFSVYADFISTAPCDQWFRRETSEPVRHGKPQREHAPLLATLFPLQEIMEWIEHEEILSFYLVQVADWSTPNSSFVKEEDGDSQLLGSKNTFRVQRLRSFKSCDEAAAAVFLDGYLQGISSIFGCVVIDSSRTDPGTYTTIKMQCNQQMHDYRDIVVKEVKNKLFVY